MTLFDSAARAGHIMPSDISEEACKHIAVGISIWPKLSFFPGVSSWLQRLNFKVHSHMMAKYHLSQL